MNKVGDGEYADLPVAFLTVHWLLGEGGRHLGPVGGRIVGEVFMGLLQLDRTSYFSQRGWRPTLPQRNGRVTGEFKMIDFLTFAGVAPDQRGQ